MSKKTRTEIEPIGLAEKLGFGTFSAASNVVFNFKDLFYLFFLTNVMGLKIAHAGIITAVGILWDASPVSNIHSREYAYVCDCIRRQFPDVALPPISSWAVPPAVISTH